MTTTIPKAGRPRKNPGEAFHKTPLHLVLAEKLPAKYLCKAVSDDGKTIENRVAVKPLSEALGVSTMTIYRWFSVRFTVFGLEKLLEVSKKEKGKLVAEDLYPFLLT